MSEVNIRRIYENDLFDTYVKTSEEAQEPNYLAPIPTPPVPKPVRVPPEPKPQFLAPLKITLKGIIIIENDDARNRAIVADNQTKKEATYKVGDVIEDAQLIKIFSNKVLFLRANGQQEVLYLRPKDAQLDPAYALLTGWKDVTRKITDTSYIVDVNEFAFRVKNLAQFIDLLDLTTVYQDGKSIGCRIGPLAEDSLGVYLGLQEGDVITTINGISASDTPNRIAIYKNVMAKQPKEIITVDLLRNGMPMTYKFTLDAKTEPKTEGSSQSMIAQEQFDMFKDRHTFAPTLRDIRARERATMLEKGQMPTKHLTPPTSE